MKSKSIIVFIILGVFFWMFYQKKQPTSSTPQVAIEKSTPPKRRLRKGPKKPPPLHFKKKETPSNPTTEKTITLESSEDVQKRELEKKLQLYFDTLESIHDPTPQELLTLGELAFDANDAESAYEHYLEIIEEETDDEMAPFALYKFAWVEFNLGDIDAAILDMELVIEWIETGDVKQEDILTRAAPEDLLFFKKSKEGND